MLCVVTFSPHPKTAETIERSAPAYWKQSWKKWTAVEPYCYSRPLSDRVPAPSLQTQCLLLCPRLPLTLTNLWGLYNLADASLRCKLWLCRLFGTCSSQHKSSPRYFKREPGDVRQRWFPETWWWVVEPSAFTQEHYIMATLRTWYFRDLYFILLNFVDLL